MSSSRLCQLIKHSKSIPIKLPQNASLIIRTPSFQREVATAVVGSGSLSSRPPIRLNINLIPQWRDDGHITLEQVLPPLNETVTDTVTDNVADTNSANGNCNGGSPASVFRDSTMEVDLEVKVSNGDIDRGGDIEGDTEHPNQANPTKKVSNHQVDILIDYKHELDAARNDNENNVHDRKRNNHTQLLKDEDSYQTLPPSFGWVNPHDEEDKHIMRVPGESTTNNTSTSEKNTILFEQHQPSITLNAKIPEKCNVSCSLHGGGNINVNGKLEGEHGFHFMTLDGNMTIHKLRGNNIDLVCDQGGIIHVKKSCEAQDLNVYIGANNIDNIPRCNRFRSKMLNVSNANVQVFENHLPNENWQKLDDDDALSIIDISSTYASQNGEGIHLDVTTNSTSLSSSSTTSQSNNYQEHPRKVRVKSNHGHLSVRATTSIFTSDQESTISLFPNRNEFGQRDAVVSLGGVNGSFDVSLESRDHRKVIHQSRSSDTNDTVHYLKDFSNKPLASSIHVDSLASGQISVLTSDHGDVELTLDRKIESQLRLLSSPMMNNLDPNMLTEEDENDVVESLIEHDQEVEEFYTSSFSNKFNFDNQSHNRISLETNAFEGHQSCDFTVVQYVSGSVENRSEEPDSRFDVKTKGSNKGAVGKIDIQGASDQALEGFSGSKHGDGSYDRPLIAIGTEGDIKLESLSWFGAISRRYGVKYNSVDLGRQAKAGSTVTKKQ